MSIRSLIAPALELQETLEDNLVSAKDKIVKTTQETLPKLNEAAEPVIDYAQDIWSRTKEFKDARNPLNWGHNIGAVGARGLESFATIDAENPQELGMELLDKTLGAKGVGLSIVKEIPVVKPIVKTAERYTDEALKNLWNGFRNRRIYSTVGVGVPEEVVTTLGKQADELGIIAGQPLKHMDNVSPSYWHRDFPTTGTLDEKRKFFDTPQSKQIKARNVKGGKITANKLAQDEKLTNQLIERAQGIVDKYIEGDQRKLYDFASHNIFNDAEAVYGTGLVKKIQQVFLVTQGREWHHMFGNKEAGEFLLNYIAQDPVITANLFKHMDKLNLKSGAIAENMALMRVPPHKAWHRFMQQLGTEPRVKMKATDTLENLDARGLLSQNKKRHPFSRIDVDDRPVRMGTIDDAKTLEVIDEQPWKYTAPLDVADYGHEIALAIKKGKTDVNELFTFLTVYHEKYVPWMKKQLKDPKFAAEYLTDLPEGPEKALLLGLYGTKKGPGLASVGTRGMKNLDKLKK